MEPGSERIGLTGERMWWIVIGVVALAMRVAHLDAAPLTAGEAREALAAWRAATGQGMPVGDYNPVLLVANSLVFTLFGTSDALARLLPALFGACLAVTPILLRRRLGRVGALVSGVYLAISPTALVASRQLDGRVIAAVGAMAFLGGVVRFSETARRGWLTLAAIGLALGVTSGAAVYGVLLPLLVAYVIVSRLEIGPRPPSAGHPASRFRRHAAHVFLTFVAAVVLFSTGFGWNLPGLGASGRSLVAWMGRFGAVPEPAASPMTLLSVYELSAVVLGIGGVIWGALEEKPIALLLGLWASLAVLLLTLMPGRHPTDTLWAVVPLAMLVGLVVRELLDDGSSDVALRAVHAVIVLILWGHAYLMLARYTAFGDRADLVLVLVTVVLQGLMALSFGLILGWNVAFRTAAAGTAITLVALTLSAGWGVAYRRPTDPREALLREPTPVNVRDLVGTLEGISWEETGLATTLAFTFEASEDSVLAWYLRDFDEAVRVDRLEDLAADEIGSTVVTVGRAEAIMAPAGREYAGQDFPTRRRWAPADLGCHFWEPGCSAAWEWFLFRDGVPMPEADRWATVWRSGALSRSDQGD